MVEACRARGVARVVKLSGQSAGLEPPASFGVMHARVEQALRESGMKWSFLRPTFFMQSLLLMADTVPGGKIIAATGKGEIAFVDARDVADAAARVLADPAAHDGRIHTLTGARALSFAGVAELLSSAVPSLPGIGSTVPVSVADPSAPVVVPPSPDAAWVSSSSDGIEFWVSDPDEESVGGSSQAASTVPNIGINT